VQLQEAELYSDLENLLVIADDSDLLATHFASFVRQTGCSVELLNYTDASLRLSVARHGKDTCVSPNFPIFLRLPKSNPWANSEMQFHFAERCSLVWAAASLNILPVVNRPDSFGLSSRCSVSTTINSSRAKLDSHSLEVFASHSPAPIGPDNEWLLEQQTDRSVFAWSKEYSGVGPFRAGRVRDGFNLCSVIVVGEKVFGDPSRLNLDIPKISTEICRALGINFASITWRCYSCDGTVELARVNPHPNVGEIGRLWNDVATQLTALLSQ
jgi:hypothetical protein